MKCKDSETQRSSSRRSASPAPLGPLVLQPGSTKPRPSLATDRLYLHNGRGLRQKAHDVGRYNAQNMWPGMEERFYQQGMISSFHTSMLSQVFQRCRSRRFLS
ncbi:hypothetical protein AOLI_G00122870 [Acnodon oligacanthus]